jgi:hypothetical protein
MSCSGNNNCYANQYPDPGQFDAITLSAGGALGGGSPFSCDNLRANVGNGRGENLPPCVNITDQNGKVRVNPQSRCGADALSVVVFNSNANAVAGAFYGCSGGLCVPSNAQVTKNRLAWAARHSINNNNCGLVCCTCPPPSKNWTTYFTPNSTDETLQGMDLVVDRCGNGYMSGWFTGGAQFGSDPANTYYPVQGDQADGWIFGFEFLKGAFKYLNGVGNANINTGALYLSTAVNLDRYAANTTYINPSVAGQTNTVTCTGAPPYSAGYSDLSEGASNVATQTPAPVSAVATPAPNIVQNIYLVNNSWVQFHQPLTGQPVTFKKTGNVTAPIGTYSLGKSVSLAQNSVLTGGNFTSHGSGSELYGFTPVALGQSPASQQELLNIQLIGNNEGWYGKSSKTLDPSSVGWMQKVARQSGLTTGNAIAVSDSFSITDQSAHFIVGTYSDPIMFDLVGGQTVYMNLDNGAVSGVFVALVNDSNGSVQWALPINVGQSSSTLGAPLAAVSHAKIGVGDDCKGCAGITNFVVSGTWSGEFIESQGVKITAEQNTTTNPDGVLQHGFMIQINPFSKLVRWFTTVQTVSTSGAVQINNVIFRKGLNPAVVGTVLAGTTWVTGLGYYQCETNECAFAEGKCPTQYTQTSAYSSAFVMTLTNRYGSVGWIDINTADSISASPVAPGNYNTVGSAIDVDVYGRYYVSQNYVRDNSLGSLPEFMSVHTLGPLTYDPAGEMTTSAAIGGFVTQYCPSS